jgi:hypothetical protein
VTLDLFLIIIVGVMLLILAVEARSSKLLAYFVKKRQKNGCQGLTPRRHIQQPLPLSSNTIVSPHPPDIEDKVPKRSFSTTSKGDTLKHISIEMSRKIFAFIEKDEVTLRQRSDGAPLWLGSCRR